MIIHDLQAKGLIHPPKWLADNCAYLTIMGSNAYAVSSDSSDEDIYGFCLPPKEMTFPYSVGGEILGFGTAGHRFTDWSQHHIKDTNARKEYDFAIFSIVRYFSLCMENNPNMIDSLFTPLRCIKHITEIGRMIRDQRKMFLHKGAWAKFKGYAYSQVHKMDIKRQNVPEVVNLRAYAKEHAIDLKDDWVEIGRTIHDAVSADEAGRFLALCAAVKEKGPRVTNIARFGFDVKFSYHVVRLISEVEQILAEGDLDLERNREQLKSIRRGDWTQQQIVDYFERKEVELETLYTASALRHSPDEPAIKQLLLDCLEHHYGSLTNAVQRDTSSEALIRDIEAAVARHREYK